MVGNGLLLMINGTLHSYSQPGVQISTLGVHYIGNYVTTVDSVDDIDALVCGGMMAWKPRIV